MFVRVSRHRHAEGSITETVSELPRRKGRRARRHSHVTRCIDNWQAAFQNALLLPNLSLPSYSLSMFRARMVIAASLWGGNGWARRGTTCPESLLLHNVRKHNPSADPAASRKVAGRELGIPPASGALKPTTKRRLDFHEMRWRLAALKVRARSIPASAGKKAWPSDSPPRVSSLESMENIF